MKNLKPIFIENSKLPVWLSKIAPIDVWAFSAGPFVVCRGELSEKTRSGRWSVSGNILTTYQLFS